MYSYIKELSCSSEIDNKEALDFLYKILYNYRYPKLYKELLT